MKKISEKISIIINCYNGEKYVKNAIESVLKQTYLNWEIIFWDNNSKDQSVKIVKKYKNKKIKIFKSKRHLKLYEARNKAFNKCKGNLIAFLDVDDFWEKDYLKKLSTKFINFNVGLVFSNSFIHSKHNKKKRKHIITHPKNKEKLLENLTTDYPISLSATIIKKKYVPQKNPFDSNMNYLGDFDLFLKICNLHKSVFIDKCLCNIYVHGGNLSSKNFFTQISELKYFIKKIKNKSEYNFLNSDLFYLEQKLLYNKYIYSLIQNKRIKSLILLSKIKCTSMFFKGVILYFFPSSMIYNFKKKMSSLKDFSLSFDQN